MTRAPDHLVGRAGELEEVDRSLDGLRAGRPVPLVLQGEPGIGKSRLLAELGARARGRGCTVLVGSASELERDLPFWIFVDALDEYVGDLDRRVVESLPADVRRELAHVLPALSDAAPDAGPVLQDERYRSHRAMRELLERLAASGPLVLVLDDVHWADTASVELLVALLRRPPEGSVLLVLAARPRQQSDRLVSALDRAERDGTVARLELGGLPRDAAGALLGAGVPQERADALFVEAGGNPFYLQQLARSAGAGNGGAAASGGGLESVGVPAAVVASLNEELGLLKPDTLRVLRGAAVSGDPFEPDLATAAAGVEEAIALEAFDELLDGGLVRPTDVPRRFRFRHPLVRRAVYESAPGGWRLGAHERSATVLAERGAPATARAHHVEFAARHGDRAAVGVLTEAGMAAILRAPASAGRWFSAALRLLPADAAEERVGLLLSRARALAAQGRLVDAHTDLLESLALAPVTAGAMHVQLTTTAAGVERLLGRHEEAHTRLAACLDRLPDPDTAEAIALMIELAIDSLFRADPEAVCDWSQRALDAAGRLGRRPLVAAATAMLVLGHAVAGEIGQAGPVYDEAAALLAAMPDDELGERVDAAAYLASAATYLDRYDDAVVHAERALRLGRAAGHLHPTLLPALGAAHMLRGRLAQSADVLDAGLEAASLAGVTQGMAWMLRNRALLALAAGDIAAGREMAEEALELTGRLDESVLSSWAALAVARASVMAGDDARAVEVLTDPDGGEPLSAIPGVWRVMGLESFAVAHANLGHHEEAAAALALAESHAAGLGLPMAAAWAHRAAATVALQAGDAAAAAERALQAAAAAEEVGVVVEGALARLVAGRALAQAGEGERAAEEIERAAAVFASCGALPHRDAAEQELRRLGRTIHRRSRAGEGDGDGVESLTGRELDVVRLVVDRRTNREIADELFLSLKTIETHLRNIFRKLGVSSRAEVARTMERAARR